MEGGPTSKQRTPSRCREWERQRRIKFNDAISKLGEIVKSINKANNDEEADNVQYPKIEIVQKAIICLTNCLQEKTQLKADILALEVKLEAIQNQKNNKKDVAIQVTFSVNKKSPNSKCVKLVMNQNTKTNHLKETMATDTTKSKTENKAKVVNKLPPKLPKLLPIGNMKKESTIVMLPATPYTIFPQRPVFFPQAPTIVLVDTNLQPINKNIINRNSNDITKTTMVNVLPISAYSHPLSAKTKKTNTKSRSTSRKSIKKVKLTETIDNKEENIDSKEKPTEELLDNKNDDMSSNDKTKANAEAGIETSKETVINDPPKNLESDKLATDETPTNEINPKTGKNDYDVTLDNKLTGLPKCSESSCIKNKEAVVSLTNSITATETLTNSATIQERNSKCTKIPPDKNNIGSEYKNKENKMQTIIDSTICEHVVDGGNARLELAEELLAASPTAAFLMSFPLVSGNRADSPTDDTTNPNTTNIKETGRRNETPSQPISYFDKSNTEIKNKTSSKSQTTPAANTNTIVQKENEQQNNKSTNVKTSVPATITNENPFLNLPLPSIIPSSCTLTDSTFGLDFDCNVTKTATSQATTYNTTNNIFYKSDPFNTVKSTIYSTSSISSGHEFNSLGLYPCAMDNYSSKNKSDYSNVEDNLMKINSSRLTYDIDLGWSHKGFDFVNCTTGTNTLHKDNILTTAATPFSTSYNPFNPEFHVPLASNTNKKNPVSKASSFPEQISLYSQSTNLWPEEVSSIYTNSNVSRNFIPKQQNYFSPENLHTNMNVKNNVAKHFDNKNMAENTSNIVKSLPVVDQHIVEQYTKKTPTKRHINWMTSEIRPLQNNCNQNQTNIKEPVKIPYSQIDQTTKKNPQSDSSYFPINMQNFPTQSNHEELQVWPTARPAGTTEISIEPPPINLPTLVGDLALGPHDKKKGEIGNRMPHTDLQNCGNFLSVTQLMNRSNDNMASRSNGPMSDSQKPLPSKQSLSNVVNDSNRKPMPSRLETHPQICYGFNDSKVSNPYENINQFSQTKSKSNNKPDKKSNTHKNNYSAESLIRGGTTCSQKLQDNGNAKYMGAPQKYNDFNVGHDSGVAQVSHFPPILDYSDNNYTGQQFSGTTLYNSTTNTISNSFYSNFMPGSSNLMTGNYAGGSFSSDFVDYSQVGECNYSNQKYNEIKIKNNASTFPQDKEPSNYKSSRRESAPKHKLECSKKESNKKYQSKRPKLANEVEDWNESHLLWQNKTPAKRHQNLMSEELPFPNYVGNQMPTQYQPDFFNSHLMQSNIQNVGPNIDRSLSSFPVASRANFNLSALFPEITMKVQ